MRAGKRGHYSNYGVIVWDNERLLGSISITDIMSVLSPTKLTKAERFGGV